MPKDPAAQQISRSAEAGFTLVEVLVALGIVAVSLFGLLQLAGLSSAGNLKSQLRDEAVLVGEAQMADLIRRPEAAVPPFETLSSASRIRGSGRKYLVTREAQRAASTDSYQFIVRVKWAYKNVTSYHEVRAMRTYKDGK